MDWLTFISHIVGSIAWPTAIIVVVVLLRIPISKAIEAIQSLKYKDLEVSFSREVQKLQTEATPKEVLAVNEKAPPSPYLETRQRLRALVEISPRAAVVEAWRELETAAICAVNKHLEPDPKKIRQPLLLRESLKRYVDKKQMHIYDQLRALRNQAVHAGDFSISTESAISYIDLAIDLAEQFGK